MAGAPRQRRRRDTRISRSPGATRCPRCGSSCSPSDTLHECWYDNRLTLVQLLIAKHRFKDASTRLERRWPGTSGCGNGFDDVLWTLARARVATQLGRTDEAVASYAVVAAAWRTADPELQPFVREARKALAAHREPGGENTRSH